MKRTAALVAVPVLAGTLSLTACSGKDGGGGPSAAPSSSTSTSGGSSTAPGSSTGTTAPADCPSESTRKFAKARFVADVGLAAGTFHRWIYKPYKQGSFKKGSDGRTLALVKAGSVAALDLKLISNAYENVRADPQLCKALKEPLGRLTTSLDTMKGQVVQGDLSSVAAVESALGGLMGTARQRGLTIPETTDDTRTRG